MPGPDETESRGHRVWGAGVRRADAAFAVAGVAATMVAVGLDGPGAGGAASQLWPPFVLVVGLLLVGLVADRDGLFVAAGSRLASVAPNGFVLFAGASVLIAVVAAVLNLDTSVVFLTPVLVYAAKSRGQGEVPLVVGCLLVSNAGSLLLPGSNLTNLIVLGHLHLSGRQFLGRMALPWIAAVAVTASAIALIEHRSLRGGSRPEVKPEQLQVGLGLAAVAAVIGLMLALRSPAIPVVCVGLVAVISRLVTKRDRLDRVRSVLGLPVLIGLFGTAVALGTLGRTWSGPTWLLSHLDAVGTAVAAAVSSVILNNLPAASLLASRVPPHPFALLIGLNLGSNLFVTGSLAWILWRRTVQATGSHPLVGRAVALGWITVPLSMGAALAMLAVTGSL